MSEITVASRYAKSFVDLAQERNALEEVNKDMHLFYETVKSNSQLRAVLRNPIVSASAKKQILSKVFGDKVSKLTSSFFEIMVNKGREAFLYQTASQFFAQYNQIKGIVVARVISATPLSEASKKEIEERVARSTNSTVILETKVDPDLIGGFVLTVGDKQYDASLAKSLQQLRKEFSSKDFVPQI
jgi:F-type H+-transporting ATPase subunit delta